MRTTIVIDDDVIDMAKAVAENRKKPFRVIINEAMRKGLPMIDTTENQKPYRMKPRSMGLKPGISLDNIQELLSQVEGEDFK
jgi:hypothetical protein